MTIAQALDRKITILRPGEQIGVDDWNLPIYGPDIELTIPAAREDVSDGERMAAGTIGAWRMTRFIVRHCQQTASILPSEEIRHEGRVHNIQGIKERTEGRRRWLEITTAVGADGQPGD